MTLKNLHQSLHTLLMAEKKRWFLWWPVGMGVGIGYYHNLTREPNPTWALSLCFLIMTLAFGVAFYTRRKDVFYATPLPFLLGSIASIALGFGLSQWETWRLSTPMLEAPLRDITLKGALKNIERREPNQSRITLTDLTLNHEDTHTTLPNTVKLKTPSRIINAFQPGDVLTLKADLLPISPPASPVAYHYRRACYFEGIGAVGRVKYVVAHAPALQNFLSRMRYNLTQNLRSALPGQRGEIAAALVTGDRSGISSPMRDAFANAGIAHILAISGLHVSLVAGMLFFTLRRLLSIMRFPFPLKKVAALLVIPATLSYVAIAGFGFPAIRAFIMVSLIMLAIMVDRQPLSMRSVALAATVVLGLFPSALLSVSFQLSFAAVIALIAFYEKRWVSVGDWLPQSRLMRLVVYTLSIVFTTLIATLATTPFTLVTFNRFTLQAVLGNMVAIPLTGVWVMPLAIASVLSLAWGGFAFLFTLWGLGIEGLIQTALWVSALPGAAIDVATPHPLYLLTFVAGGLWLCLWRRAWRFAGVVAALGAHLWLKVDHLPHIYIAPDASVAALRESNILYVSTTYKGSFWVNQWLKENGLTEITPWPEAVASLGPVVIQGKPWADIREPQELCHTCRYEIHLYETPPLCPQSHFIGPEDIRTHQGVFIHLPPRGQAPQIIKPARRPWN